MQKKTLVIDVDEVICDSGFLSMLNKFLNSDYKIDDFKNYYIDEVIPENKKSEFYEFLKDKNLYENPIMIDGAVESIRQLAEKYDILICSNCVMFRAEQNSGMYFKYKYDFLLKTFPFLNPNKFIFTGFKNHLVADIQIDDRIDNLESKYIDKKILMSAYHNKNISSEELVKKGIVRVDSWNDIVKILL